MPATQTPCPVRAAATHPGRTVTVNAATLPGHDTYDVHCRLQAKAKRLGVHINLTQRADELKIEVRD